jgi:hypothetical protein
MNHFVFSENHNRFRFSTGDNPWERDRAIWGSPSYYFKDLNANRGNDVFATKIRSFMEEQGILNDPLAILGGVS